MRNIEKWKTSFISFFIEIRNHNCSFLAIFLSIFIIFVYMLKKIPVKKAQRKNNVEDRKARTRAEDFIFFSFLFFFARNPIETTMCLQRRREKVKKRKREKEARLLSFFFFFLFFPWEIPREIHRHRVFMRETTARDVTVIYYAYPRIHTRRDVLKPLYTGQPVWRTNCSAYTCHRRQGSQLRQWARVVAREDGFSRLETSRVASNFVIKTAARRRFRYEKLWGGEEKILLNLFEKNLWNVSRRYSRFAVDLTFDTQNCYILQEDIKTIIQQCLLI